MEMEENSRMITLEEFLKEHVKLPSPKAIAVRILEAVRKDEDSFAELADIIKSDPALTARILKVANSPLYGRSDLITSPAQAIGVIGTQALKNIALSFVIFDHVRNASQGSFDLNLFWRRAITAAVAAETLARRLDFSGRDIFVTSLLQDFGVLVLFLSCGAAYTEVLDAKRISGKELHEEEMARFGFHHAEIGYRILKSWNLPPSICEPIRQHHLVRDEPHPDAADLLNLADRISSIYHGSQCNRRLMEVHARLEKAYGFTQEESADLIDVIGSRTLEVIELFSIPPGMMKPFSLIIQEANEELARLNYTYEQLVLELTQAKRNAEQLALELKHANASLRDLALRDGLTGLYNHKYFQDAMGAEVKKSQRYDHPLSLLMLDIDHFKDVNDTFGHPVGDQVLKEVSELLVKLVRHGDIVARYGGEEFAVILPETGTSGAKVLAHRLRRGIEQHRTYHDDTRIPVTVSIGLTCTETLGPDVSQDTLVALCDQALYMAKRNGRNRVESCGESEAAAVVSGK